MIDAFRRALGAAGLPGSAGPIEALADTGLAHLHLRLAGTGWLARIPKQSQIGLDPVAHLAYEAACFDRAAASGHVPRLHATVPPSAGLPWGALLVDEVQGRPLRLPDELDALVQTLAALHALPLAPQRAPLFDPPDVLAALAQDIATQAAHLPAANLAPVVAQTIEREWLRLQALLAEPARPPRHLIAFDAHPGNFLLRDDGLAVLVDLEKARYGAAALDLAHATLYTSTTWDLNSQAVLNDAQVLHAANAWLSALAAAGVDAQAERHWVAPLRRAMWLWSITWCAKWRAQSGQARQAAAHGEDWSTALSDDSLVDHVRNRVDHYLSAQAVDFVCTQADRLAHELQA